ncbi:MAG: hypothetical protein N2450_05375 [bacterium]|nr:hypothetical protein [bacterium]
MIYSRISSGLEFLDATYGGLYSNRSYLLRGPSQSGRTTAALQFLLAGVENNEAGILISSDRIENVILKAESVGLSLENYLMDNRLILMEYPKDIINGRFQLGGIIHLLGEIERYINNYGCSRIVFDTIIPLLSKAREPHLTNYVYSLMNSLDALHGTILVTSGEPNSPVATRITELLEDAVVGSFVLSSIPLRQGTQKTFSVHKMINPLFPPQTFKIKFEYGTGIVLDESGIAAEMGSESLTHVNIQEIPLHIAVLDRDEDTQSYLEDIFAKGSHVVLVESEEELLSQHLLLDYDVVLINTRCAPNWHQIVPVVREANPKQPIYIISESRVGSISYQAVKQIGADGLFYKPMAKQDVLKAIEKAFRTYGILDDIIEKRLRSPLTNMPVDFESPAIMGDQVVVEQTTKTGNLITLAVFKEQVQLQILKSNQGSYKSSFALVSFRMISTPEITKLPNLPLGLELVKKVANIISVSLRGANDRACRSMDKVIVLLEDCDKEGAEAFVKRVFHEMKSEIQAKLNIQIGKHLMISNAIAIYPKDGSDVQTLISHVTDHSRNFKLIN